MWGRETPSLPFDGREGVSESASFLFAIGVFLLGLFGLFGLFGIVDGNRLWFGSLGFGLDLCPFLCCALSLTVFGVEFGEFLGCSQLVICFLAFLGFLLSIFFTISS